MTPKPLITIVIPTRNRCDTLVSTLKTCVEQDYEKLSIIVSDNCSDDKTREVIQSFVDKRIRYIKTPNRLSMTGNFEFSLQQTEPGYIGFIGDDDGLMPGAVEIVAKLIVETGSDAITSSSVFYTWPNFPLEGSRNIALVRTLAKTITWKDAKHEVARLVSYSGLERNYAWGLPSLYRGFINSDVIRRATSNGRYFHSVTPDAYSAFVNSFFIDSYIYLDTPLTIEGVSGKSNGASQIFGKDQNEEKQYLKENDIAFNDALVYAPSPPIILAEAYMQARAVFPQFCVEHDFSVERVCKAALRYLYPGQNQIRVTEAVAQICRKNGLPELSSSGTSLYSRFTQSLSQIRSVLRSMEVQCECFDAYNVYQASIVVSNLLAIKKKKYGIRGGTKLLGRKIMSRFFKQ